MSWFSPRPQDPDLRDDQIPDNPRGLAWKNLEAQILKAYQRGAVPRTGLRVVHPRDMVYQAALVALRADDWNEEVPRPFFTAYEFRGRTFWLMTPLNANLAEE